MSDTPFTPSVNQNLRAVTCLLGDSFDLIVRELDAAGTKACTVSFDGLCDEMKITEAILKPLTAKDAPKTRPGSFPSPAPAAR